MVILLPQYMSHTESFENRQDLIDVLVVSYYTIPIEMASEGGALVAGLYYSPVSETADNDLRKSI